MKTQQENQFYPYQGKATERAGEKERELSEAAPAGEMWGKGNKERSGLGTVVHPHIS